MAIHVTGIGILVQICLSTLVIYIPVPHKGVMFIKLVLQINYYEELGLAEKFTKISLILQDAR